MAPREDHNPQVSHTVHDGRQQTTPRAERPALPPAAPEPVQTAPVAVAEPPAADTPETAARAGEYILPPAVISRADIGKCLREIEKIDDYFHQEGLRGRKDQPLPTVSRTLESLATANGFNMIRTEDRSTLKGFLARIKAKAPSIHMSFPSEASDDFIAKLLDWFRKEVHPYTVLNVGLQPELAAGCTLRTVNKFYDFSFRARFEESKQNLIAAIEKLDAEAGPLEMPAPAAETVAAPVASESTSPAEAAGVPAAPAETTAATEPAKEGA